MGRISKASACQRETRMLPLPRPQEPVVDVPGPCPQLLKCSHRSVRLGQQAQPPNKSSWRPLQVRKRARGCKKLQAWMGCTSVLIVRSKHLSTEPTFTCMPKPWPNERTNECAASSSPALGFFECMHVVCTSFKAHLPPSLIPLPCRGAGGPASFDPSFLGESCPRSTHTAAQADAPEIWADCRARCCSRSRDSARSGRAASHDTSHSYPDSQPYAE